MSGYYLARSGEGDLLPCKTGNFPHGEFPLNTSAGKGKSGSLLPWSYIVRC
ncbi:hypothetical protein HMPREF9141_1052 [Prevotella multiformis DSM 16608]|uniref:Uncharacterized protein n=1 Tax=Prevotella multiformis DSM 16608 TaxID=888743 RepID=F0F635_9BACT|nr:hypothetical protein HMPREF9141_1052 [Prevotella multiformis DSM 16608]